MGDDDHEKKIVEKIEEFHELQVEAMRRAGVAKEKEQGLEIESTESVRLFREAQGYVLRLRELREDLEYELYQESHYHPERIIGHIDDFNRILGDIRDNPSFENSVSSFNKLGYSKHPPKEKYEVDLDGRTVGIKTAMHTSMGKRQNSISMGGTTVQTVVLPRLIRFTKEVENSLIGRCASGKRPN